MGEQKNPKTGEEQVKNKRLNKQGGVESGKNTEDVTFRPLVTADEGRRISALSAFLGLLVQP